MLCFPNIPPLNADKSLALITNASKECNQTNYEDLELIYKTIYLNNQDFFNTYQLIGIIINLTDNVIRHKPFDSPTGITGKILWNLPINLAFQGCLFNVKEYIIEGKKFGVFTGISVLLIWYAWGSLWRNMSSALFTSHLSLYSLIILSFSDFIYAIVLFDYSKESSEFFVLYTFISICMVPIFLVVQGMQNMIVCIGNANDLPEGPMAVIKFFVGVLIFTELTVFAACDVFDYPIIYIPFLYSFFIPQIVHSAKTPGKKKGDEVFVIFTAIQKLFPAWYFLLYKKNILELYYPLGAILCTIYVGLQVVIILLQNRYGGDFFLPEKMRLASFDYHSLPAPPDSVCAICMTPIEEGDDIMVTPCHHAFHTECLSRWMEEQLVCPYCRSRLLPIRETTV